MPRYTYMMGDIPVDTNNTLEILPDGIMQLTQRGFQTGASVVQYQTPMDELTVKFHQQGKKSLILVDMTDVTGHDAEAREKGEANMKGDFDAMAICGTNTTIRILVSFIVEVKGMGGRVKLFKTRDEGLKWLREQASASAQAPNSSVSQGGS